jgi:transcriptional regulator with XRE-family HTH domain
MSIGDGIGERIRHAREEARLTASQLAREAGVTPTAVWNWERNQIAPRYPTLRKVAECLGVSEEYLRTGQKHPANREASDAAAQSHTSVARLVEETRLKIAEATGFPFERVRLHLELVAD